MGVPRKRPKDSQTPFEQLCSFLQFLLKLLILASIFRTSLPHLKKRQSMQEMLNLSYVHFVFGKYTYDDWAEKFLAI